MKMPIKLIIALFRKSTTFFNSLKKDSYISKDIIELKYYLSNLDPVLYNIFKLVICNSSRFEVLEPELFQKYITNDNYSFETETNKVPGVFDKSTSGTFYFVNRKIVKDGIEIFEGANYLAFILLAMALNYIHANEDELKEQITAAELRTNALKEYL